jgi:flagellum-specific peptidoglycan hydrolase FlgJ
VKAGTIIALVLVLVLLAGGGAYVVKTLSDRELFLRVISDEVQRQLAELNPTLTPQQLKRAGDIVASQAAHETEYGRTPAWVQGWNFSNLTGGPYWHGEVVNAGDTERRPDGSYVPIQQAFRKYGGLAEAVSDYIRALNWPSYKPALVALLAGDEVGFVTKLHDGGWFTQDVPTYLAAVQRALPAAEALA